MHLITARLQSNTRADFKFQLANISSIDPPNKKIKTVEEALCF
jgi:NADH dehydrogenase FAD-containing subunit